MKFLKWGTDGGKDSGVTGFWIFEIKNLFSIAFLRFAKGTRENYHSHAFNAYSWFISGEVEEQHLDKDPIVWKPSIWPKSTPRSTFHRVNALKDTYAFTIRGPWSKYWYEYDPSNEEFIKMQNGRKVVERTAIKPDILD